MLNKLLSRAALHEHADPAQRVLGVAELPAESPELAQLLRTDPAADVRAAAARRCADRTALVAAWHAEGDADVKRAMAESLGLLLEAQADKSAVQAALDDIGEQQLLAEIAVAAPHAPARLAAAERVTAPEVLRWLADAAKDKDRGVARIARGRLEAMDRRAAQAVQADALLAQAEALVDQPGAIVMAAVDLERRWKALALADDAERIARWEAAGRALQARFDREREQQRAVAGFDQRLAEWLPRLAATPHADALPALRAEMQALRDEAQALNDTPALAKLVQAEQAIARWEAAAPALAAAEALVLEAEQLAADTAIDNAQLPVRWQAIDIAVRTPDLTRRFEAAIMVIESRRLAQMRATQQQETAAKHQLHELLHAAEKALAEGHLQEARAAADQTRTLKAAAGTLPKPTIQRLSRLVQQLVEMERWVSFGQHSARVQLAERAEALLARAVSAAPQTAAPAEGENAAPAVEPASPAVENASPAVQPPARPVLPPAELAREVQKLRAEWKALDAQHEGVSKSIPQSLWKRFDTACERAYAPAARHFAELHAQRKQARKTRDQFIAAAAEHVPVLLAAEPQDLRAIERWLRETDHAWHGAELGSVEPETWKKLEARMKETLAPLREVLGAARGEAKSGRQALIAEAEALGAKAQERDAPARARALQARWTEHAKAHPLAGRDERVLWERFRAACNAVFEARDSARKEVDGRRREQRRAYEVLCTEAEQLAQTGDGEEAEIRRRLRDIQSRWKDAQAASGPVPAALDARFRAARTAVEQALGARSRGREAAVWQALLAKARLCEEIDARLLEEGAARVDGEELRSRWQQLPALSAAWEQKMAARRDGALSAFQNEDARYDHLEAIDEAADARRDTLLELELALGLPSPAELNKERLAVQVRQLRSRLKTGAGSAGSAGGLLLAWCALPGVADARDHARCELIVESLQRRA